jgi:hypothetical protein
MSPWAPFRDGSPPLERFELKYLITQDTAVRLRRFVAGYLEPDEHVVAWPEMAYAVHTLYLDSADLHTYRAAVTGSRNRFKLRLRYYDGHPEAPIFFEVKGRVNNCIVKRRSAVRREAVSELLAGQVPWPDHLVADDPAQWEALQRFSLLQHRLRARPMAHNGYLREAWVCPHGTSVRVTFDREIGIEPARELTPPVRMGRPTAVFPGAVVLELKFTERFPQWLAEMVRRFGLMQSSAAKYCAGMASLAERGDGAARYAPVRAPVTHAAPAVSPADTMLACPAGGVS